MRNVGDNILAGNANWSFRQAADSFDEHVARSVPFYNEGHDLICKLTDFFLRDESVVYELGCSTAALGKKVLDRRSNCKNLRYVGLDSVPEMVDLAQKRLREDPRATILNEDISLYDLEKCSVVLSYYTIQFINPSKRQEVINKIYQALEWGGAFILFEKVRGPDARFQDIITQIYNDFKLDNGFSEEEIIHKSRSLKGVLEPFSTQGNLDMLKRAGFNDICTVMKSMCFEGFLAIK